MLTVTRKDGTERLVEFSAFLGVDEELWIMRDVTDAVHAERELIERGQRLDVAVTASGLGIWEWDLENDLVTGDRRTLRLFGLADADADQPRRRYVERVTEEDRARFDELRNTISAAGAFDVELRVRSDHGRTRWLRLYGTIDDTDARRGRVIGAVRDIDSYKRLDERLVHAAQMESLGQLAGGVAHDFNNLLAVIQGQVEFVMKDPGLTEKSLARLSSIERAVTRGADMVAALMQLGRSSASSSAVIDVHEQVESALDSLERMVGADITVSLDLAASSPFVRFDEARFSAVILNLATNARDAMPLGGHLALGTRDVEPLEGNRSFELTIEDTGIGMDAETRERIFEPFFTTKNEGLGTGLGLASVYDTVLDAGGSIDVTSTPGAGTTFTITFPVTLPAAVPAAKPESPTDTPDRRNHSILVVEDDAAILDLTAELLRNAGYDVATASGPDVAIERIDDGVVPDLLLTDVVMPGMSGPVLADILGARLPAMRVLFMSGYTQERQGAVAIDADQLIHKPFNHRQLLDRIDATLARGGA